MSSDSMVTVEQTCVCGTKFHIHGYHSYILPLYKEWRDKHRMCT